MKLIKPSFEILEQKDGIQGMYEIIESAGRTCYKSEDKITEDSAEEFVNRMIKSGHGAMLEHATVYLYLNNYSLINGNKYRDNAYSKYVEIQERKSPPLIVHKYITTNYRVLVENGWLSDLEFMCDPTKYHKRRISVKFICDRGVSHKQFVA